MSRSWIGLLASCLVVVASLASSLACRTRENRTVQRTGAVVFYTDPPGARVMMENDTALHDTVLGFSNLDPIDLKTFGSRDVVSLLLRKAGYQDRRVTIPRDHLGSLAWPAGGALRLWPNGPLNWARYLWSTRRPMLLAGLAGLAGLTMFGLGTVREIRRARRLETYRAAAGSDPFIGSTISDYRLVEFLGRGGYGSVYRAVPDATLDERRCYAVKLMELPDQQAAQRFEREMKLSRRLRHPNIVRVVDYGDAGGLHYIVMEYAAGRSLESILAGEDLAPAELMAVLAQVAEGVEFAHRQGIIHRDLKPENIQVGCDGQVKILDFGLARELDRDELTATGDIVGTLQYMAPEQLKSSRTARQECDQYAFAVIAYRALCGALPYPCDDLLSRLEEPPVPLEQRRPEYAGAVSQVLERALAIEPAERFASIQEAFRALEGVLGRRL